MATKLLKMVKNVIVDMIMKNVMTNVAIQDKFLIEIGPTTYQLEVVHVELKQSAGIKIESNIMII